MTKQEYDRLLKEANCNADMNAAFQTMADYIDTLEATLPKWHEYPKTQPPVNGNYLIAMENRDGKLVVFECGWYYDVCGVTKYGYWTDLTMNAANEKAVRYWMPLPSPPEEEE